MKWIIIIMIILLAIPIVTAICCERNKDCIITETCQDASCGNCTISIFNRDGSENLTQKNMTQITAYTYMFNISRNLTKYTTYPYAINCTNDRVCQGDCQVEIKQECEEQEMSSLAITFFILSINALCFVVPFKKNLSQHPLANYILKRCCIILGLFLLSMNTAVIATLADYSGFEILDELFRYLWLINWATYLTIIALFWATVKGVLKLMQQMAEQKKMDQMGYDESEW